MKNIKKINSRYLLIIAFVALLVKELIFVAAINPWKNHDEAAHFAYTQYLVEEKRLPVYEGTFNTPFELSFSEEFAQSRIAINESKENKNQNKTLKEKYLAFLDLKASLKNLDHHPLKEKTELSNYSQIGYDYQLPTILEYKNPAVIYPPLYYLIESIPYLLFYNQDIITRLYAMRIFSVILFLITVFFCYLIAKRLTNNFSFSFTLMIIIGFQPIFSYSSTGINNDALLITAATITIYLCLKLLDKLKLSNIIWLGIISGIGLLSKTQFIVFLALAAVPFIYHYLKNKIPRKEIFKYFIFLCIIILLIAGWWFIRNYFLYNNFLGPPVEQNINQSFLNLPLNEYLHIVLVRLMYIFATFSFNLTFNLQSGLPPAFMFIGGLLLAVGLFGFCYYLYHNIKRMHKIFLFKILFLMLSIFSLETLYFYLFMDNLLNYGVYTFPVEGRYFFPVILPIIFLWLWGIKSLIPKKQHLITYFILGIGAITLNIVFLIHVIFPRFFL